MTASSGHPFLKCKYPSIRFTRREKERGLKTANHHSAHQEPVWPLCQLQEQKNCFV